MATSISGPSTLQKIDDARALMLKSADGAQPKDPFMQPAWDMAGAHGMILLGLRTIYEKAPKIRPQDHHDFVLYCLFWCACIHHHHEMEEEFYFNDFKGAVSITNIVEEHNGFRSQLDEMSKYLESCLPPSTKWGPYSTLVPPTTPNATFDANELVRLIDKLTEVFIQHFCDEIGYLEASKLRPHLSHDEVVAINKKVLAHIMEQVHQMIRMLPMSVTGVLCNVVVALAVARAPGIVLVVIGCVMTAIAPLLFALIITSAPYWAFGFPAAIVSVFGADFIFAGGSLFVAKVALPHEQSLAGGLFNTLTQIGTSIGLSLSSVLLDRTIASKSKSLGISVPSGGTAADSAPKEALLAGYRAAQWLCFAYVMVGLFLAVVFLRDIGIIAKKPPKASLHSASIHESEVDEEARFSEDKKEQRIDENSEDVKKTTPISTV